MITMTHNRSPDCVAPFWKKLPPLTVSHFIDLLRLCSGGKVVFVARQHGGKCALPLSLEPFLNTLWEIKCPTDHNDLCLVLEHLQNFEPPLFSRLLVINDAVIRTTLALYLPVLRSVTSTCSQVASQRSRVSAKCQRGELHERDTPP